MTGLSAVALKAAQLHRLARFKAEYPGVVVLAKAFRPVAYPAGQTVYGADLGELMDKLDQVCPPRQETR